MTNQTCKAAVLTKRHTIEVMDVQMPECGRDGMIIKLEAASICGTDLHLFEEDPAYPVILGHELCGRVVEMGPDAAKSMRCYTGEVKLGDRICLYPWVVCGTCENCLTYGIGACGVCDNSFVYGVPYESLGFGGAPIRSNSIYEAPYIKGGFGEYMYVFPGTFMWQVIALSGVVSAKLINDLGFGIFPAMVVGVLVGIVCGLISGIMVAHFEVPALIATLAMQTIARGFAFIMTQGIPVYGLPESIKTLGQGYFLGIPIPVYILALVFFHWLVDAGADKLRPSSLRNRRQ